MPQIIDISSAQAIFNFALGAFLIAITIAFSLTGRSQKRSFNKLLSLYEDLKRRYDELNATHNDIKGRYVALLAKQGGSIQLVHEDVFDQAATLREYADQLRALDTLYDSVPRTVGRGLEELADELDGGEEDDDEDDEEQSAPAAVVAKK